MSVVESAEAASSNMLQTWDRTNEFASGGGREVRLQRHDISVEGEYVRPPPPPSPGKGRAEGRAPPPPRETNNTHPPTTGDPAPPPPPPPRVHSEIAQQPRDHRSGSVCRSPPRSEEG